MHLSGTIDPILSSYYYLMHLLMSKFGQSGLSTNHRVGGPTPSSSCPHVQWRPWGGGGGQLLATPLAPPVVSPISLTDARAK